MTTASPDIDLAALIADTEGEIVSLVRDRDPSTHGLYEMVRYHLALDGSGASGGKRMRPLLGLLAYASITGDHQRALPGAAAVELGHNFSLVHDDIEDGDVERRHRPTLWTIHGVPQAINTGDTLFSLSRIALHRLTDLGFPDSTVLRLMRLYDETCLALCEGQYIDIAMSASDELISVDRYFDMIGRKTAALIAASIEAGRAAGHHRRAGHRPLPRLRLGAGPRLPAERRPARHLGPGTDDRQGTVRRRPPQEDAAGHLRGGARRPRGSRAAGRAPRRDRPHDRRGRRDHRDPRAHRSPRVHPRPGPPLPGPGPRRARCRGRRQAGGARPPRADHRLGHRRLASRAGRSRSSGPPRRPRARLPREFRTTRTLPTRRLSVVSTVRVNPSTTTWSPGLGTPPMRW